MCEEVEGCVPGWGCVRRYEEVEGCVRRWRVCAGGGDV